MTTNERAIDTLTPHPDSALVPEMRPNEYAELLADVKVHGVKMPLDVLGDVILDGRHRLKAARESGRATVPVHDVDLGGDTPRTWMIKAAVLRRHLSDDQRAMMAALYAKANPAKRGPEKGKTKVSTPTGSVNRRARASEQPTRQQAAVTMNVSPKRAEKAAMVLSANPELAAKVHSGEKKLAQAAREIRHAQAIASVPSLTVPDGLFDVIVIDPPWQTTANRRILEWMEVDYATMSIDDLGRLRLPGAVDCVLWIWTTNSFMREAYDLAATWGFTPKTILTWDKGRPGLGNWLRNATEHCLLTVKGHPHVTLSTQTTIIRETRREHSRKPDAFYTLVDSLCLGRKLDYFGRTPRPGWQTYGLESERFADAAGVTGTTA